MEILAGIKFGGWVPNYHRKRVGGFKFGGSVRYGIAIRIYASKRFWWILIW